MSELILDHAIDKLNERLNEHENKVNKLGDDVIKLMRKVNSTQKNVNKLLKGAK